MEATLAKGSRAKARLDGKRGLCGRRGRTLRPLSSARSYAPPMADTLAQVAHSSVSGTSWNFNCTHYSAGAASVLLSAGKASRIRMSALCENLACLEPPNTKMCMHCGSASMRNFLRNA